MATNRRGWQGGFILVTVIFLILIGVLLLAGMAFLYGTAGTQQSVQNGGAQAFMTAESSDQYGVFWLETHYATPPLLNKKTTVTPLPVLSPPDCMATVTILKPVIKKGTYTYTVQSVVPGCAGSGAQRTIVRIVTAVKAKAGGITYKTTGWIEE